MIEVLDPTAHDMNSTDRIKNNLATADGDVKFDGLEIREKFTHGELNFTGTPVVLNGEPLFKIAKTGGGLPRIEPLDDGTKNTEKFEEWMEETLDDQDSVAYFLNLFVDFYAVRYGHVTNNDTLMINYYRDGKGVI